MLLLCLCITILLKSGENASGGDNNNASFKEIEKTRERGNVEGDENDSDQGILSSFYVPKSWRSTLSGFFSSTPKETASTSTAPLSYSEGFTKDTPVSQSSFASPQASRSRNPSFEPFDFIELEEAALFSSEPKETASTSTTPLSYSEAFTMGMPITQSSFVSPQASRSRNPSWEPFVFIDSMSSDEAASSTPKEWPHSKSFIKSRPKSQSCIASNQVLMSGKPPLPQYGRIVPISSNAVETSPSKAWSYSAPVITGRPISLSRFVRAQAIMATMLPSSHSAKPEEYTAFLTKYYHVRSTIDRTLPLLLYVLNRLIVDRYLVIRQENIINDAAKFIKTGRDLYNSYTRLFTSFHLLGNIYRAFNGMHYEKIMADFEKLLRKSKFILNERTASLDVDLIPYSHMDIDTDVELLAGVVVKLFDKTDVRREFEYFKADVITKLQKIMHYCKTLCQIYPPTAHMLVVIKATIEHDAESFLKNYNYEEINFGQIVDPKAEFFSFMVNEVTAKRLHAVCDQLLPPLKDKGDDYTHVERNIYLQKDLHTLARLMQTRLSFIEEHFMGTRRFLRMALFVTTIAEERGFNAPYHAAAAHMIANGMWSIDDIRRTLATQIIRIRSALQNTDYKIPR